MADVWGGIVWHVLGIGEAAAQAATIDHVGAELGALPEIGSAGRGGPCLGVGGVNVVVGDVGKFVIAEQVLVRNYVCCALAGPGDVAVNTKIAALVLCTQLDAFFVTPVTFYTPQKARTS